MIELLKNTRKNMMTGVSYMIPFVVAGGILLALSVLLSGNASVPDKGWLADIANIGITGLGMMVPILSGYIAFSMVDRPGLAPGIIGGLIASNIGAGFLGGILSGILAGVVVFYLKKIKLPSSLRSLGPIFIIPLFGTLVVGVLMYWVIGQPIAALMTALTKWLESMGTGNLVVLGLILGAMICIPPLAMGLATIVAPKKFTVEERNSGKAAIVMGMVGISEGAIPFAAADPLRCIPANMIGSAIGAAIAMVLGAGNPAPWGGWIVAPVAQNPLVYILGTVIGSVITAGIVIALKKPVVEEESQAIDLDDDFDLDIEIM